MSQSEKQTPGTLGHRAVLRTFTPAQACALLEKNQDRDFQRPVSQGLVMRIAEDLRRGRWLVNGETIIIDKHGRVLDGQHRLWGCFESGKDLATWVIEGVEPGAFQSIDTGRARSASDMVGIVTKFPGMTKLSQAALNGAARAIRLLLQIDKSGRFINWRAGRRPTNADVAKYAQDNPSILDEAKAFAGFGKWPIPVGFCLAVHFVTRKHFEAGVHDFWHPLQSGIGINDERSALAILREKAVRFPRAADFIREGDVFPQVIKAWNSYAVGKPIRMLKYAAGSEAFPTICLMPGVEPVSVMNVREGRKTAPEVVAKSRARMVEWHQRKRAEKAETRLKGGLGTAA